MFFLVLDYSASLSLCCNYSFIYNFLFLYHCSFNHPSCVRIFAKVGKFKAAFSFCNKHYLECMTGFWIHFCTQRLQCLIQFYEHFAYLWLILYWFNNVEFHWKVNCPKQCFRSRHRKVVYSMAILCLWRVPLNYFCERVQFFVTGTFFGIFRCRTALKIDLHIYATYNAVFYTNLSFKTLVNGCF